MTLKIGQTVTVKGNLEHARYGGWPARPDFQLKNRNASGKIVEERKINNGEKEISIYKLSIGDCWYSESMFSKEDYIKKEISIDIIEENIVLKDRKNKSLIIPKSKANLLSLVVEAIEKKEEILIHETKDGNIYMNKYSYYEVFTDFDGVVIEILEQDLPKYKEFLESLK